MLQYECDATPEGLRVTFSQKASWVSSFAAVVLVLSIRYFGLSVGRLTDNRDGLLAGISLYLAGVGSVILVMAACFALAADLKRHRCLFFPDGIALTLTYLGIPFRTLIFNHTEIHKFGWGRSSHGASYFLRFAASGQRYYLASDVTEHEVAIFIELLASNGIVYSNKEEPLQRRNAANTLLG